ncbi:hypothetical protein bpln_2g19700 [Burkholderia plantarii]|nr:hypothetical protein bpln_2g19700 [Burkholderia plantarii]
MNFEATLEVNPQLSRSREPGVRALEHPTMPPEPLTAFDTTAGNTGAARR